MLGGVSCDIIMTKIKGDVEIRLNVREEDGGVPRDPQVRGEMFVYGVPGVVFAG